MYRICSVSYSKEAYDSLLIMSSGADESVFTVGFMLKSCCVLWCKWTCTNCGRCNNIPAPQSWGGNYVLVKYAWWELYFIALFQAGIRNFLPSHAHTVEFFQLDGGSLHSLTHPRLPAAPSQSLMRDMHFDRSVCLCVWWQKRWEKKRVH